MAKIHKHEFTIYDLYQTYAVCHSCGEHDWGIFDDDGEGWNVEDFKKKYPEAKVVGFEE